MALTDAKVRNAKPQSKRYKIYDGEGLSLLIVPTGGKYWRFTYRFAGKEKLLAFGVYPEVTLADARERRAQARKALAEGSDPGELKREAKRKATVNSGNTFEVVAREWHKNRLHELKPNSAKTTMARMERYLFPKLGNRPVADISASELLAILREVEEKEILDTVHRLKQYCDGIFRFAVGTDRASNNPVPNLRGVLKTPVAKHRAYLKAVELPEFLNKLNRYDTDFAGALFTRLGLQLLILTFVRTMELRGAQWREIDLGEAEWRIPPERMKMKETHIVPLSKQSVALLRELKKHTGTGKYLFPNEHNASSCMSENTLIYALYRMGYRSRATVHGFRSTASTILNEHGFPADVIERQLAHTEPNQVRAAYNHAQYLPERRKMMQWWADHLDGKAKKS